MGGVTDPQQSDGFRPPAPPPVPPAPPASGSNTPQAPNGFLAPGGYQAPGYPTPGAAAPAYQAPVGAYQAPIGGYQVAAGPYSAPAAPETSARTTGVLALILSLAAAIVVPIIGATAAFAVGSIIPNAVDDVTSTGLYSLAFLAPARDQVLWAEISFWAGTVLGIAAFVLGIVAIVKRRGRGQGIAGLIIAVLGPVVFFTAVFIALTVGAAVGAAQLT